MERARSDIAADDRRRQDYIDEFERANPAAPQKDRPPSDSEGAAAAIVTRLDRLRGQSPNSGKSDADNAPLVLYRGTSGDSTEVADRGAFGGVFASASRSAAASHGKNIKTLEIPRDKVLRQDGMRAIYASARQAMRKAMPWLRKKDLLLAESAVLDDAANSVDADDMMRIFRKESVGEASWEAQRIRGIVARSLGYQAVEMSDEHGTSYLVLPGAKLRDEAAPEPRAADEPSAPKSGTVRMYHGGNPDLAHDGPLWFTSSLKDAEGWAARGDGMKVLYVDIPEDSPQIEADYPEQTVAKGNHVRVELPASIAAKARPLATASEPAAAEDDKPDPPLQIQYGNRNKRGAAAPAAASTGSEPAAVQAVVDELTKTWRNAPPIEVYASPDAAPKVRGRAKNSMVAPDADAAGVYVDGKVMLFANNLENAEHAQFVLLHETLGHHGLLGTLGTKLRPAMRTIYSTNKAVREKAQAWMRENDSTDIELATEESLSDMAAADIPKLSGWKWLVAAIRDALRRAGFTKFGVGEISDNDIAALLSRAAGYVRDGTTQFGAAEGAKYHKAWHGSPHDFDRFDTRKVGTGEGNQSEGWGIYFASEKAVAEWYRKHITPGDPDAAIQALKDAGYKDPEDEWGYIDPQRYVGLARELVGYKDSKSEGRLYEVELLPREHQYLDLDKPYSKQSEHVKQAIERLQEDYGVDIVGEAERSFKAKDPTGFRLYSAASRLLGGDRQASEAMWESGIPGNRYLDAESRDLAGRGDETDLTHNYVIFDDVDAQIEAKYSKAKPLPEFDRSENRVAKLSSYTDVLYREISPADLNSYLPTGRAQGSLGRVYFSNKDELAAGQGDNRGVMLELDPEGISGIVNTNKPTWRHVYDQGSAEFISDNPSQQRVQKNIRRVVVDPKVKPSLPSARIVAKNVLGWLETERGWTKNALDDGRVEYVRPDSADDAPKYSKPRRDQVDTPEFKKWFGSSKVVDENGEPLVVYHGTERSGFTTFDPGRSGSATGRKFVGIYFTNHPLSAQTYSGAKKDAPLQDDFDQYDGEPGNYSVYLSIQNPAEIDFGGQGWDAEVDGFFGMDEFVGYAERNGFDGVIASNVSDEGSHGQGYGWGDKTYVVFKPEQIKSAIGNTGTFDPANPDIRYSKAAAKSLGVTQPPAGQTNAFDGYTSPTRSMKRAYAEAQGGIVRKTIESLKTGGRNLREKFIDELHPLLTIENTIKELGTYAKDMMNAYQRAELFHGRAASRIQNFRRQHVQPLLDEIAKSKTVTLADLESYLYAQFAPRRNEIVREMHDGTTQAAKFADNGSGMTDQESSDILDEFKKRGVTAELEALAKRVYAMNALRVDYLEGAGLLSKEEADEWRKEPKYVPLRGFADGRELGFESGPARGKGFSVGGKESPTMRGRTSRATDLLANTIAQVELAYVRAEKNAVGQALLSLVLANPNKELWEVARVRSRPIRDPLTGEVLQDMYGSKVFAIEKPRDSAPDIFNVKVDGKTVAIRFNGPSGEALAGALKNLGATQLGPFMRGMRTVGRIVSQLRTSWNPEFVLSNFARDVQTAFANLSVEESFKFARRVMRLVGPSLTAFRRGELGKTGDPVMDSYYREFLLDGGKTDYANSRTIEEITKDIQGMVKDANRGVYNPRRVARRVWEWFQATTGAVENASRLAAYIAARENGRERKDAASMAKNLTVNFNRHGTAGPSVNALWNFTNAAIQGNARYAKFVMKNPGVAVKRNLLPLFVMGFVISVMNGFTGGDDDDGEENWAKVPDHERERNLILMWGKHKIKIPMPYTYNLPYVIGSRVADVAMGRARAKSLIGTISSTLLNAANPLGQSSNVVAFASPTLLDPLVEIGLNENFAGRPIMPESSPFDRSPKPDSQQSWESTPDPFKWIAEGMNAATGGSAVRPGAIDVSPTTMNHLWNFALGGVGAFAGRAWTSTAGAAIKGEAPSPNSIPFLRTVYGRADDYQVRTDFYAFSSDAEYRVDEAKLAGKEGRVEDASEDQLREWDVTTAEIAPALKAAKKDLEKLKGQRKEALAAGDAAEAKALDVEIRDVQAEFNKVYVGALRSIDEPIRPVPTK